MSLAPIALFVYNRPEHTRKTINALKNNIFAPDSELIIFSDSAKTKKSETQVKQVRNYLETIKGFRSVTVIKQKNNLGLANSIISGITKVVNNYGKIIVLEDDLITSPYFLKYMNNGLDLYEDNDRVISIHGYVYPTKNKLPNNFFLRGADCWGWATWKRAWDLFERDGQKLLNELETKNLSKKFNWNNAYPYTQILKGQIKGFNDSWAIRWHASAFLKNKLTLYPSRSLVTNIGFNKSGTHTKKISSILFNNQLSKSLIPIENIAVQESYEALQIIKSYLNRPLPKLITLAIRLKFYLRLIKYYVCSNR